MFRLASALPSFRGGSNAGDAQAKVTGEDADQVLPLSTATRATDGQEATPIQSIPPWVRELNNSRVTRHSRASSIVSTQTKFTTNTLQEDARSIDINVGGQYFRISRDGSRVTADAPPPYTGPGETIRFRGDQASDTESLDNHADVSLDEEDDEGDEDEEEEEEDADADEPEDGAITPRSTFEILDTNRGVRANILDPTEFEMPSPIGDDRLSHRSSSATLVQDSRMGASSRPRPIVEQDRDPLYASTRSGRGRRAASQEVTSTLHNPLLPLSPLRRTNGVRLPRLITSSDIPRATQRPRRLQHVSSRGRQLQVQSADAVLGNESAIREPRSPDYIGRNARGPFPFPARSTTAQDVTATRTLGFPANDGGVIEGDGEPEEHRAPPAMDDENDISLHYARMMRTLDAAHRKALHFKEKQIAELREKLNEKDIVLRQQLRAKDFIIEDLKKRLNNLQENIETRVEAARNMVEDTWESRWKDRDFHMRERMRRIEEDARKTIDGIRAEQAQVRARPAPKSPSR
jgi:hypothetical protein